MKADSLLVGLLMLETIGRTEIVVVCELSILKNTKMSILINSKMS